MQGSPLLALALGVGCGASEATVREPTAAPASALPDAGAASEAAESKALIQAQLHAHAEAVFKCLVDYLVKNDFGRGVAVDFAIGQEGTLVDVVVWGAKDDDKGLRDPELKACMTIALHDATFPKSRSGIITVQQAYEGF